MTSVHRDSHYNIHATQLLSIKTPAEHGFRAAMLVSTSGLHLQLMVLLPGENRLNKRVTFQVAGAPSLPTPVLSMTTSL